MVGCDPQMNKMNKMYVYVYVYVCETFVQCCVKSHNLILFNLFGFDSVAWT